MDIVVQKYGGTSVNKPELRQMIVQNIADAKEKGLCPVVVVSAMGRHGEPYATDTLLEMLPGSTEAVDPRNRDLLISCGEIISCVIVAEDIRKAGYTVKALTGYQAGIKTNGIFGNSDIIDIDTSIILNILKEDTIPVIAGFQGQGNGYDITTLGRGGSDITATALGAFLNAACVEIYTDVDGVMTADPKVVNNAQIIEKIDYEEVFQLAEFGAKVIHPRAVEYAQRGSVPVVVLNTRKGRSNGGTIISKVPKSWTDEKIFTAITSKDKQVQIKVKSTGGEENLFDALAQSQISIDMINIFIGETVFIIDKEDLHKAQKILEKMNLDYEIKKDCSKITIVGSRIAGVPGIIAKIMSALSGQNIKVWQSSDSYTTISILVDKADEKKTVALLHEKIF